MSDDNRNSNAADSKPSKPVFIDLENQGPTVFHDQKGSPFAAFSVLEPAISVELVKLASASETQEYVITSRFNLQTSICNFEENERYVGCHTVGTR